MPHIIFKRDRYTPIYACIGNVTNYTIVSDFGHEIKNISIDSLFNMIKYYDENKTLKFKILPSVNYESRFQIIVNKPFRDIQFKSDYINTITTEFDIDCSPYDVGEKVYVSSTNEFHKLISRYRDDIGNWIYETELVNNIGDGHLNEIYTDEEVSNFESVKSENINLINKQIEQVEIDKQEVIEQIKDIVKNYYKLTKPIPIDDETVYDDYSNGYNYNISWFRKLMNKIGL